MITIDFPHGRYNIDRTENTPTWLEYLTIANIHLNTTFVGLLHEPSAVLYCAAQWVHDIRIQGDPATGQIQIVSPISTMFPWGAAWRGVNLTLGQGGYHVMWKNMPPDLQKVVLRAYYDAMDPSNLILSPAAPPIVRDA